MKKFDQLAKDLAKSFKTVKISFDLDAANDKKLYYQKESDRDFGKITDDLLNEMASSFVKEYVKGDIVDKPEVTFKKAMEVSAEVYRKKVISRFGFGMKDIFLKPLSLKYIKQKGNAKIGINTGELLRDIKSSKIKLTYKK